jgi:hypothetical protein
MYAHACQRTSSVSQLAGPSLREPKSRERCCEHLHPSLSCGISPERAAGVDPASLLYLSSGQMGADPVPVAGLPALSPIVQILFCSKEHAQNFNGPLEALNCNRCLPQATEKRCLPCVTQKPMLSGGFLNKSKDRLLHMECAQLPSLPYKRTIYASVFDASLTMEDNIELRFSRLWGRRSTESQEAHAEASSDKRPLGAAQTALWSSMMAARKESKKREDAFVGQKNCEVAYSHISIDGHELFHKRYLSKSGKEFQEAANLYGASRARYFQRVLRLDGHVGYALRTNECGIFADRWIS